MKNKTVGYTPGPWTFRGMFEPTGDKITYKIIGGVTKADGVLIATAPELLEAAQDALWGVENLTLGSPTFNERMGRLKAAIAKAEGR